MAVLFLVVIVFLGFSVDDITYFIKLKNLDYSNNSIKLINDNELEIDVYSKTLDNIIDTNYFDKNNVSYYLDIEFKNSEYFFDNINKLIDIGYNSNEINTIYDKISNLDLILEKEYNENILDILNSDYYKEENLERYLNHDSDNVVLDVNMYLDYDFYTHDIEVSDIDNLVIVNKYYKLDKNYEPELFAINRKYAINERQYLTKEAKLAFEEMCDIAKKDGVRIYSGSAYRSYSYQNTLYNNRVKSDGVEYANKTAAKAGYSEHQTGLAIDILNGSFQYLDSDDNEYKWLIDNSYKYGFILRYPSEKEEITGYSYEPWHFRYLGIEVATILKEKNITYEEYIGMK